MEPRKPQTQGMRNWEKQVNETWNGGELVRGWPTIREPVLAKERAERIRSVLGRIERQIAVRQDGVGDRKENPGTTRDAEKSWRDTWRGSGKIRLLGGAEARNRRRLKTRTWKQGKTG